MPLKTRYRDRPCRDAPAVDWLNPEPIACDAGRGMRSRGRG